MSYTALYRKFRPQTFDEVKGQEHIVTTLKNQIKSNRIGHAYLFTGTRGTGKTSIAKIFARAVNCENSNDGSPCNQCKTCKNVLSGSSMNVIEIDAASNNGVENIRQIRDEVQYSPTEGRYKVYIIDEVHMLSIGAFNALLKTLEEPPEYVIFILATTEVHKIPITILSRCQRYDFRRITVDIIADRLTELINIETADVEPKAVRYIAKAADGSMRDALSLLDQCLAFYMGQRLTYDNVLEVLGAVDTGVFSQMLKKVADKDITECIKTIDEIVIQGRELGQFVLDFTWYLRNVLLIKKSDDLDGTSDIEEFVDASRERIEEMKKDGKLLTENEIMRYIHILSELSNSIKYSASKRVLIEIAFIKMTRPEMENNLESVIERLNTLEKKIKDGITISNSSNSKDNTSIPVVQKPKRLTMAIPEDVQFVVDNWYKIEQQLGPVARNAFSKARFSVEGENTLLAVFDDFLLESVAGQPENVAQVNKVVGEQTGKEIRVVVKLLESGENFDDSYVEITKKINMDIEEEDF